MRLSLVVCGLVCWTCFAGEVSAQEAGAAEPGTDTRDRARELYAEGARAYDLGSFEKALSAFKEAYRISGAEALLFNIAQAHRLAGHCHEALGAYRAYLRRDTQASNRQEVEERIAQMEQCVEREAQATETSERRAVGAPELHTEQATNWPPLLLAGAGVVVAGTGLGLYLRARQEFHEAEALCPCPEGEFDNWERLTDVSYAMLGLGGAMTTIGLGWWLVAPERDVQVGVDVGYGTVRVHGRF